MSCLTKMSAARGELSASELKIADFILSNSALIRDYSSQNLAASVGVSQSSIVKFSQKLGYRGFTDLKLAIHESVVKSDSLEESGGKNKRKALASESLEERLSRVKSEVLASTVELNDERRILAAVKILENSERIQILAHGVGSSVARNFSNLLIQLGKWVIPEVDSHAEFSSISGLARGDALFVISFFGQSAHLIEMTRMAKKAGVAILSLTDYSANPIRSLADAHLFALDQNGSPAMAQIASSASQQHVVDVLFGYLADRDKVAAERLARSRKRPKVFN